MCRIQCQTSNYSDLVVSGTLRVECPSSASDSLCSLDWNCQFCCWFSDFEPEMGCRPGDTFRFIGLKCPPAPMGNRRSKGRYELIVGKLRWKQAFCLSLGKGRYAGRKMLNSPFYASRLSHEVRKLKGLVQSKNETGKLPKSDITGRSVGSSELLSVILIWFATETPEPVIRFSRSIPIWSWFYRQR